MCWDPGDAIHDLADQPFKPCPRIRRVDLGNVMVLKVEQPREDRNGGARSRPVVAIPDGGVETWTGRLLGSLQGSEETSKPVGRIRVGCIQRHAEFLPCFA